MASENPIIPGTSPVAAAEFPSQYTSPGIGDIDVNTQRPYSLTESDATALLRDSISTDLKLIPVPRDIFEQSMTDVSASSYKVGVELPNSIGARLTAGGANITDTIPLLNPMVGGLVAGNLDLEGLEDGQTFRYVKVYYQEQQLGVATLTFGVKFNTLDIYGTFGMSLPQLKTKYREIKGRQKRECLINWFPTEMTLNREDGTGTLTQFPNPNWFIGNAYAATGQAYFDDAKGLPEWSGDVNAFAWNIYQTLNIAAGADGTAAAVSMDWLDDIIEAAEANMIEPLEDENYALVLSTSDYNKLSSTSNGMPGSWLESVERYTGGSNPSFVGEVGKYKNLRIVKDNRSPELLITGTNATDAAITTFFMQPGREDDRPKTQYASGTLAFNANFLLGKGAYIERVEKDITVRENQQGYGKKKGIGIFEETGFNLNVAVNDTNTGGDERPDVVLNSSSMVVVTPVSRS